MDSILVYTADPRQFWRSLSLAAARRGAVVHGSPPEIAIEVDEARLYIHEGAPEDDGPPLAVRLGAARREFVVDIHNPPVAEAFLADVIDGLDAVVDDDHGSVMPGVEYVARVRTRHRQHEAARRGAPPS